MKNLIKKCIQYILQILLLPVRKKNIIILSSIDSISYKTNTRYLFEYLSENLQNFNVYYVTESRDIKKYLDNKNLKYIKKIYSNISTYQHLQKLSLTPAMHTITHLKFPILKILQKFAQCMAIVQKQNYQKI